MGSDMVSLGCNWDNLSSLLFFVVYLVVQTIISHNYLQPLSTTGYKYRAVDTPSALQPAPITQDIPFSHQRNSNMHISVGSGGGGGGGGRGGQEDHVPHYFDTSSTMKNS